MKRSKSIRYGAALVAALSPAPVALAQETAGRVAVESAAKAGNSDLAKQLSNPIADLISLPFQLNYNDGYGADGNGEQTYLNIQPVIPITLNSDWNVISRTIVPIVSQDGLIPDEGSQFGFGNTTQSLFFSPQKPTEFGNFGMVWGVGPVFQIPTATGNVANNQWLAGLTGVALVQEGPWTVGALANHLWSVSGNDKFGDVSASFLQPFVSYTTPKATSFTINTETTYDWKDEQWSIPINALVGQVVKIGNRPVQFSLGARYWADAPEFGPEGWGGRFQMTLLFPK